jgi:hypothetical protein
MHTQQVEVLQPFFIKIIHKYKIHFFTILSSLVLHHTSLQESPPFQQPTTIISNELKIHQHLL